MALQNNVSSTVSGIAGNVFRDINQSSLGSLVSDLNSDSDGIPASPFMLRQPRIYFNHATQRWLGYYRPTGKYGWLAGYCILRDHGPRGKPVMHSCYSRRCLRPLKARHYCKRTHKMVLKKTYRLRVWGKMGIDPAQKDLCATFRKNS